MAVEENDAFHAHLGKGGAQVFDEGHEGRDADLGYTRETGMGKRQRVANRRRHERAQTGSCPPRDFGRDNNIGQQGGMRPVLFHGTDGDNDGVMLLQEGFEFGVGEFSQEYSGWFHGEQYSTFSPTVVLCATVSQRKRRLRRPLCRAVDKVQPTVAADVSRRTLARGKLAPTNVGGYIVTGPEH